MTESRCYFFSVICPKSRGMRTPVSVSYAYAYLHWNTGKSGIHPTFVVSLAGICHKSRGSRPRGLLSSVFNPFPFSLVDFPGGHPLSNILMHFIQSNSLIKYTLMFNVLQKSACMQSSVTVGRTVGLGPLSKIHN